MDYDTAAIRHFITRFFDDDELNYLCADYFREVYEDFSTGMGKRQKVHNLVEYCYRHGRMPDLMAALERERLALYQEHFGGQPAPAIEPFVAQPVVLNPRQVFISHAHQDVGFARQLTSDLHRHGYSTWLAPDSIRPGEKWAEAIQRGLQESVIFVVVLTPSGVASRWVQTETNIAIELEHKGMMRFVPLQVQPCEVPLLWTAYQHVPFGSYESGLQQLLQRLADDKPDTLQEARREQFKRDQEARRQIMEDTQRKIAMLLQSDVPFTPSSQRGDISFEHYLGSTETETKTEVRVHPKTGKEMMRVLAGEFLYGQKKEKMYLPEYWIDKTPVTNAEYKRFLDANPQHPVPYIDLAVFTHKEPARPYIWDEKTRSFPRGKAAHPVVLVSWHDANAYAEWAGKRLPTEEEWEKAARGTNGREYPWGNKEPTPEQCNFGNNMDGTTPVGRYSPQGDSPYGCADMSGNVWEWTGPWSDDSKSSPAMRGGAWHLSGGRVRVLARVADTPNTSSSAIGFRLVSSKDALYATP